MTDIDSLSLQVKSDAAAASRGLDSLAATLEKLKNATSGGLGLSSVSKGMKALAESANAFNTTSVINLKEVVNGLSGLKALSGVKLSNTIASTIEGVKNAISGVEPETIVYIREIGPAIATLSAAKDVKLSPTLGQAITSISDAAKGIDPASMQNVVALSQATSSLKSLNGIKVSSTIAKQLVEISTAVETLNSTPLDFSVVQEIASAVAPLATVGKANLTSAISQLKKIPDVARDLEKVDVGKFKQTVSEIASALAPLADEMARISAGFSAFPIKLQKLVAATDSVSTSNKRASMSYTDFYSAMRMAMGAAKRLASWISKAIQNSNDYIESINLFNASMGTFADQATKYADKVADVMGIDPAVWMENQGVFMTLATGFGVAGERAYIMSQQLTQLGYDLSSFFNLPVEEAMQKLQSGLSGELEPLRRLGFDLSQARLEAIAFSLGIDKAYSSMSQAEKSQLRYYAIMTQVTTAQGDMARTLESPANQLRILSAQATQAARAFGNALIPVLNKILPFAIAAAKAIRILAASVASLFGYELPEVDYSGITGTTGAVEDLTDSIDGASGSAKKLKSYLMGFDELNVIDPNSGSGGGGGGGLGGITGDDFDFDLPQYDFIGDAIETQVDRIMEQWGPVVDWIKTHMNEILTIAGAISSVFGMWKISSALTSDLNGVGTKMQNILGWAGAIATAMITWVLSYKFTNDYLEYGKYESLIADGLVTGLGTAITAGSVKKLTGSNAAANFTAGAMILVDAVLDFGLSFGEIVKNGFSWSTAVTEIIAVVKTGIGGSLIAKALGLSVAAGGGLGLVLGAGVALGLYIEGVKVHEEKMRQARMWGDVALTAEEVRRVARAMFDFDIVARINLINTAIEGTEKARTELNDQIAAFQATLNKVRIGVLVGPEDLESLVVQAQAVVASLQSMIDAENYMVNVAVSLLPAADESGIYNPLSLVEAMGLAGEEVMAYTTGIGNTMATWLAEGITEGLYNGKVVTIQQLAQWLTEVASAARQAEIDAGFEYDLQQLLGNMEGKSFEAVMAEYNAIVADYRQATDDLGRATTIAISGRIAELKAELSHLSEGTDEYERVYAMIATLEAERDKWLAMDFVDAATAGATDKGQLMLVEAWTSMFEGALQQTADDISGKGLFDLMGLLSVNGQPTMVFGKEAYGEEFATALVKSIQDSLRLIVGEDNFQTILQLEEMFGLTGWDLLSADMQAQIYEGLRNIYVNVNGWLTDDEFAQMFYGTGLDMTNLIASGVLDGERAVTDSFATVGEDVAENMGSGMPGAFHRTGVAVMERYSNAIADGGAEAVTTAGKVSQEVADALSGITGTGSKSNTRSGLTGLASDVEASVTKPIVQKFGEMQTSAETTFSSIKTSLQTQFSTMSGWFGMHVSKPMVNTVKNAGWYDAGRAAAQGIKKGIESVELPKFQLNWDTVTKKVGETTINLPILDLKFYAKGGMPTTGEMFVARESGPEMVGRIGSRSAVANNDQIVVGIEEGVYRAVTAAMSDSDNNVNVNVYLDGKEVYHNQQQVARATGYQFAR